jgi:hypothetical protein
MEAHCKPSKTEQTFTSSIYNLQSFVGVTGFAAYTIIVGPSSVSAAREPATPCSKLSGERFLRADDNFRIPFAF